MKLLSVSVSVALLASLADAKSSIRNSNSRELAPKTPAGPSCSAFVGLWEATDAGFVPGSDGSKFTASFRCETGPIDIVGKCDIIIIFYICL